MKKVIFVDRDGVINKEKNYLYKIEDFEFVEGTFLACKKLNQLGFDIIIVTNQSGIARGYYTVKDYEILTDWMKQQFSENEIKILDVFYCPHKEEDLCGCRKPKPGMIMEATKKYNVDLTQSWLIGDNERDIEAGIRSGIKNLILLRSGHVIDEKKTMATYIMDSIKNVTEVIK